MEGVREEGREKERGVEGRKHEGINPSCAYIVIYQDAPTIGEYRYIAGSTYVHYCIYMYINPSNSLHL